MSKKTLWVVLIILALLLATAASLLFQSFESPSTEALPPPLEAMPDQPKRDEFKPPNRGSPSQRTAAGTREHEEPQPPAADNP